MIEADKNDNELPTPTPTTECGATTTNAVCRLPIGHVGDHTNGTVEWVNPDATAPVSTGEDA